ncbi:hypothetical protein Cni_G26177 [Canna indica]|uniref:CCHC-type domain-containing protein n=1 Tax=Canna indica TaxID=4628 RepID=A0AAQ3QR25_9LILI|nr:hypothetical protein Cni_G26177 [Canna indica]
MSISLCIGVVCGCFLPISAPFAFALTGPVSFLRILSTLFYPVVYSFWLSPDLCLRSPQMKKQGTIPDLNSPPFGSLFQIPKMASELASTANDHLNTNVSAPKSGLGDNAIKALAGGPWAFRGNLINLRPWKPNFKALGEEIISAPIWVQFLDLPMEYWSNNILFKIASLIGKPIKAVRYERLPNFCFKCGMIGHRVNECSFVIANDLMNLDINRHDADMNVSTTNNADSNVMNASVDSSKTLYGPWVRVTRKPRNRSILNQSYHADKGDLHDNMDDSHDNSMLNDVINHTTDVENIVSTKSSAPIAPFTFNTLVEKVSPELLKIKETPNLKPIAKTNKDKGKPSKIIFGKGKSPKTRIKEDTLTLDSLLQSKKKRVRKEDNLFDTYLDSIDSVLASSSKFASNLDDMIIPENIPVHEGSGTDSIETHLSEIDSLNFVTTLDNDWSGSSVGSNGNSGGLLLAWKNSSVKLQVLSKFFSMINAIVQYFQNSPWLFSGIYASVNPRIRNSFWNDIGNLDLFDIHWFMVGDFNCVVNDTDKLGGSPFMLNRNVLALRNCLTKCGFMDLGFNESKFTWCNNRKDIHMILIRLDKTFGNACWLSLFGHSIVTHLPRAVSDHSPLLIEIRSYSHINSRSFKFQNFWVDYHQVSDIIKDNSHIGSPLASISSNLSILRGKLSFWNRNYLGRIEDLIDKTNNDIRALEVKDCNEDLSHHEITSLSCLYKKIQALNRQLSIKWWTLAKTKWVNQGEKNTKYYQNIVKLKKR